MGVTLRRSSSRTICRMMPVDLRMATSKIRLYGSNMAVLADMGSKTDAQLEKMTFWENIQPSWRSQEVSRSDNLI